MFGRKRGGMGGIDVSEQINLSPADAIAPGVVAEAAAAAAQLAEPTPGEEQVDAVSLMEQYLNDPTHDYKSLKYGDVMDGVIMHLDREEILVDIGSKSEGIVPSREYSSLTPEERQALSVGDTI